MSVFPNLIRSDSLCGGVNSFFPYVAKFFSRDCELSPLIGCVPNRLYKVSIGTS